MKIINIYFPESLIKAKYGFLSGIYVHDEQDTKSDIPMLIIDDELADVTSPNLIGQICSGRERRKMRSTWLTIRMEPHFDIRNLTIKNEDCIFCDFNIIFYNGEEIRRSYLLSSCSQHQKVKEAKTSSHNFDIFIDRVIHSCPANSPYYKTKTSTTRNGSMRIYEKSLTALFYAFGLFRTISLYILNAINGFLKRKFDIHSYFINQTCCRLRQLDDCCQFFYSNDSELQYKALIGVFISDIILGFLSSYIILTFYSASEFHLWFRSLTSVVAENVQELLHWLSGVPAGLKLNQPLAESLSSFFSYHVYLWTLYLEVANPVLEFLVHFFVLGGILGISSQVALLVDFFNLAVLHVHCFYIYAARLHMIQMSLLGSQWRAFRGTKWNPLKGRVDTRSDHSQSNLIKVLSAVNFTLVVFLLPTTTLYYAVFTTFRILLALFQGFVSLMLWALNRNPVYIVFLYLTGSPLLKGNIAFNLESNAMDSNRILLRLFVTSSSLKDCLAAIATPSSSSWDIISKMKPKLRFKEVWTSLIFARELL